MTFTYILGVLVVGLALSTLPTAESCSCDRQHPQTKFCKADFVILARVKRSFDLGHVRNYKIRVKREFKMSEKARLALKTGKLLSPSEETACGVRLAPRRTYLVMGQVSGLQAHVNLCSQPMPWKDVTPRQRKGVRLLYSRGCDCNISYPHRRTPADNGTCRDDWSWCHHYHGLCLRSPQGRCTWLHGAALRRCQSGRDEPH